LLPQNVFMFGRVFAGLLIVLTVLPFTAPFPACDASTLFGDRAPSTSDGASLSEGLPSHASLLVRPSTRMKPLVARSRMAAGSVDASGPGVSLFRHALRAPAAVPASRPAVLRI